MALSIVTTEQIAAAPAAVWAFISDVQRYPEWVVGTNKMPSVSTGQVAAGTEYRELSQIGPGTFETTWRITTIRAPQVPIHESHSGMLDTVLTMTVEAAGDGTRLVHRIEGRLMLDFRPLGRLLERLLRRRVADDMRQTLCGAKHILECELRLEQHHGHQQ